MSIKGFLRGVFLGGCLFFTACPLSENTATYGAVVGGGAFGVGAGVLAKKLFLENRHTSNTQKFMTAVFVSLGFGISSWWILKHILFLLTPRGKLVAVDKILRHAGTDPFLTRDFVSISDFANYVSAQYNTNWPLVLAREHLVSLMENLHWAQVLIKEVLQETYEQRDNADFFEQAKEMNFKITEFMCIVENRVHLILQNQDFSFQVSLYEEYQEAKRQREHDLTVRVKVQ